MFGRPIKTPELYSDLDRQLAVDMVQAWTNFAKTGNPGKMGSVQWKEAFDRESGNYFTEHMQLDPINYKMVSGFYKQACDEFWKPRIFV